MSSRQPFLCFEIRHPPANAFYRLAAGSLAIVKPSAQHPKQQQQPEPVVVPTEAAAAVTVDAAEEQKHEEEHVEEEHVEEEQVEEEHVEEEQQGDEEVEHEVVEEEQQVEEKVEEQQVAETVEEETVEEEEQQVEETVEEEEKEEKQEEEEEAAQAEQPAPAVAEVPAPATPTSAQAASHEAEEDLPLFTAQTYTPEDKNVDADADTSFTASERVEPLVADDIDDAADLTFATAAADDSFVANRSALDDVDSEERSSTPTPAAANDDVIHVDAPAAEHVEEEEEAQEKEEEEVVETIPEQVAPEEPLVSLEEVSEPVVLVEVEVEVEVATEQRPVGESKIDQAPLASEQSFKDIEADSLGGVPSVPSAVSNEPESVLTSPSASDEVNADTASASPAAGPAFRTRSRKPAKMPPKAKTNGAAVAAAAPAPEAKAAPEPTPVAKAVPAAESVPAGPAKRVAAPDEQAYQRDVKALTEKIDGLMEQQKELNAKIRATGNINDTFSTKTATLTARQNELRTVIASLRGEVGDTRRQRENQAREAETLRKSLPYQTTEEIDKAISDLEKRIASATLKLVEERKCVQEIATLKRARGSAETLQKKTTGAAAATPATAATSAKEAQLDAAIAELETIRKELNGMRDARSAEFDALGAMRTQVREISTHIRQAQEERSQLNATFNKTLFEHRKYAQEEQNRKRDEERVFRQQAALERKKALEEKRREERTLPKFVDKIDMCTNLSKYLGDTYKNTGAGKSAGSEAKEPPKEMDGLVILKKDRDEDFFEGVTKKNDKGSKAKSAPKTPKAPDTIKLPLKMVEQILSLDIALPTTAADVDKTLEALASKRAFYERRQAEEIRKGEEEERLEREREAAGESAAPAAEEPEPEAEAVDEAKADEEEKEEGEI